MQNTSHNKITLSSNAGDNSTVMNDRFGKRTSFIIQNQSSTAKLYMKKGLLDNLDALEALEFLPKDYYTESSSEGFQCWQGPVQIFSDTASAVVTVIETFGD